MEIKRPYVIAGPCSEENYDFLEANGITPYVKYIYFHKEQKRSFREDIRRQENLHYNAEGDYLVCPCGRHMRRAGERITTDAAGHSHTVTVYRATPCDCISKNWPVCCKDMRGMFVYGNYIVGE